MPLIFRIALVLVMSSTCFGSRTIYVTPSYRETLDFGTNNGTETVRLHCNIVNNSSVTQTFRVYPIQAGSFNSTQKNTQTTTMATIGPITLNQNESYTLLWSSTTGPAFGLSGATIPKTFSILVDGDNGFLTGSCSTWYINNVSTQIISAFHSPINSGRPF